MRELIKAVTDFYRHRIRRHYWIIKPDADAALHIYPNRDLMRHEAIACWCGPRIHLAKDTDGVDRWIQEHHSLDARERRSRT